LLLLDGIDWMLHCTFCCCGLSTGFLFISFSISHMPVSARVEQYKALVELKKQGLAKHIGVSNFTDKHIQDLLDAGLVRTIRSCSSAFFESVALLDQNDAAGTCLVD
jgi:hypothetical protein